MERWNGKVAVVTGASMGIGAVITEKLLDAGIQVVGIARQKEKFLALEEQFKGKKGKFHYFIADIRKEENLQAAFKWISHNVGPVYILINNAGSYREKGLLDGETEAWKEVLDTNILAVCIATREAIKGMRANNIDGQVIHLGSIVSNDRLPNVNVFIASKQAVTALTETLRQELNSIKSKIKISCISPGAVRAPVENTTTNVDMLEHFKTAPLLEALDIANAVMYILSTPPHVQVQNITIRPVGELI